MRLAVIRRHSSPTGGAELYLERLMDALSRAGHEVHLLCEAWEGHSDFVLHPLPVRSSRARRPVTFANAVEAELERCGFDCVFSLERTRRQDVYRAGDGVHRAWLEQKTRRAPWWQRPFVGWGAFHRNLCELEAQTFDPTRTRRVIVNSAMVGAEIARYFRFPKDRMHLVRNGIVTARFQGRDRAAARARFGLGPAEFVLLFVGSGWERKGLRYLIGALSRPELQKRRLRLLVVGKGRPPAAPDGVVFAGPIADVEQAYAAADLFAFLPIYEPSSNVVAEALASGLPVVTSIQNGAAEWLEPGVNGDVVPDPADLPVVAATLARWIDRGPRRLTPDLASLSLERNVEETIAVLELAARERRR